MKSEKVPPMFQAGTRVVPSTFHMGHSKFQNLLTFRYHYKILRPKLTTLSPHSFESVVSLGRKILSNVKG